MTNLQERTSRRNQRITRGFFGTGVGPYKMVEILINIENIGKLNTNLQKRLKKDWNSLLLRIQINLKGTENSLPHPPPLIRNNLAVGQTDLSREKVGYFHLEGIQNMW